MRCDDAAPGRPIPYRGAPQPLRTAEYVSTPVHMLKGRLGVGFVRACQARWVHTFRVREDIAAVGPWNHGREPDAAVPGLC